MGHQLTERRGFQTGHIGLNVSDLERSKQFYRQVFGFEVMGESQQDGRRFLFLGEGANLVLTLWQQASGRFEKQRPGLHHLSFQVGAIEEVKEAERKLRGLNVPLLYDGIVPHAEGAQSGGRCDAVGGDDDHPVDLALAEDLQATCLFGDEPVRVGEEQFEPGGVDLSLHRVDELGIEGVGDDRHDHADDAGAALAQCAGDRVDPVAEIRSHQAHPLDRVA